MDFIQYLRDRISELRSERDAAHTAVTDVLAAPTAESRDLNETEAAAFAEARDHLAEVDTQIADFEARLDELVAIEQRHAEAAASRPTLPAGEGVIGAEARTYRGFTRITAPMAGRVVERRVDTLYIDRLCVQRKESSLFRR